MYYEERGIPASSLGFGSRCWSLGQIFLHCSRQFYSHSFLLLQTGTPLIGQTDYQLITVQSLNNNRTHRSPIILRMNYAQQVRLCNSFKTVICSLIYLNPLTDSMDFWKFSGEHLMGLYCCGCTKLKTGCGSTSFPDRMLNKKQIEAGQF